MLNRVLTLLGLENRIISEFNVSVGKYVGSFQGKSYTYFGVDVNMYKFGEISPKKFLGLDISHLYTFHDTSVKTIFSLGIFPSDFQNYRNSKIRLIRRDNNVGITLPWFDFNILSAYWSNEQTDNLAFFSEKDVGKTIPVSIIYTPPKLKHFSLILLKRLKAGCTRCAPVFLRLWRW